MNQDLNSIEVLPAENPKFSKIRDLYQQPDFVRNSLVRFMAEYCHVMKIKAKWLNPKFAAAILKVRRPFGTRLKILMKWRKTVLKKHLHHEPKTGDPYRNFGRVIGASHNLRYTNEKLYCPIEEKLMEAAFAPFQDIPEETKKRIEEELDKQEKSYENSFQLVAALPLNHQNEFWAGFAEGQCGPFTEKLYFTDALDNTKIYHLFLLLGDLVREFDTVEDLFDFFKLLLKHEMPHSLDTFKRICNDLGVCGARYTASMRRKKSIESKKRVLPLTG